MSRVARPSMMFVVLFALFFGIAVSALAPPARAGGNTITVDSFDDEFDDEEDDCELREAVQSANTGSAIDGCGTGSGGTDIIVVPAGTYTLTIEDVGMTEDTNATGDLDVTQSVDINSQGGRAIIDGGARPSNSEGPFECVNVFNKGMDSGFGDRILHVLNSDVDLNGLDVTGGFIDNDGQTNSFAEGGGILVESDSSAHLTDTRVYGNLGVAFDIEFFGNSTGGGIKSYGILTLSEDSRVTGNALDSDFANGGGISAQGLTIGLQSAPQGDPQVALDIDSSRVNGNLICSGLAGGGGIFANTSATLTDSRVANNLIDAETSFGGGIQIDNNELTPEVAIVRSDIENNTLIGPNITRGGGISNNGHVLLDRSTVAGNSAEIASGEGTQGGGVFSSNDLIVDRSTINNNSTITSSTDNGPEGKNGSSDGGGLYVSDATTIVNSTVAENEADRGGGIYADTSNEDNVDLTHVTIADNFANEGGGLYTEGLDGSIEPTGTIFGPNDGNDCGGDAGFMDSSNWNLDSDGTCELDQPGDLADTNPQLNNLGNNGGPTQTIRPQNDSPVVDHVGPTIPKGQNGCPPPQIDQRGTQRPQDGDNTGPVRCDIGAVEISPAAATPECPGFEGDPRNDVIGTNNVDILVGTPGDDIICARKADDDVKGKGGDDLILGGPGSDSIEGNNGDDRIKAQGGEDNVAGGDGDDHVNLGIGDDIGNMGPGADNIQGHTGDDVINGQGGDDNELRGELGEDTIMGGAGDDKIGGNFNDDVLKGEGGNDNIVGGRGGDDMRGGANTDKCRGGGQAADSFSSCEDAA